MLKCKIHRATVTKADLNYIGSLTLDEELMELAGLKEFEKIQVLNITNGNRLETYVIKGKKGSKDVCINGAAAHLVKEKDIIIIAAYYLVDEKKINNYKPKIIHVNNNNKVICDLNKS
tara:strand:+ start:466 stop:819 length:354 start_codon:yes stop_codon:yes gene_type:complete